jgi:hypothetical protein
MYTKQGVRDLNAYKAIPLCARAGGSKNSPCTPSRWEKTFVYPNAAFNDFDLKVDVEIRRCLSCGAEMDRKNYGKKFFACVQS